MSARTRIVLAAAVAALSLAVAVAPAMAGKNGPNNTNAKLCQKGGWGSLFTDTGGTFDNERECTSYAAMGGTLLTAPPQTRPGEALCAQFEGVYSSNVDFLGRMVSWQCFAAEPTPEITQALLEDCEFNPPAGAHGSFGLSGTQFHNTFLIYND
jgi:hypothetical protein